MFALIGIVPSARGCPAMMVWSGCHHAGYRWLAGVAWPPPHS